LGGLPAFAAQGITSYAHQKTIELARANQLPIPAQGFVDSLVLPVGKAAVVVKFFGEGHTKDNVVAFFSADQVLFGGCLIKEINATKGYLGDANTRTWSNTVQKIAQAYPQLKWVVPGHGASGSKALLDYTQQLFRADAAKLNL
jgi:metallo-beta-lactamase class B